jgi:pimeloyl-ACP methyl ester carboxylesterase
MAGALVISQPSRAQPSIRLEPCRIADIDGLASTEARCGTLSVPENPSEPDGDRIRLAVAVVPAIATTARPDPLVLIAGGPGQGSIEGYAPLLGAFAGIRRERDLVLLDQRGTGSSNRLDCDMPEDALENGDIPPAALAALARDCLPKLPGRAQFYTTSIAVGDLEAVRQALGYERLNLYGASYGTRVAQHYARRYPARSRAVVLDGVVPPGLALVPNVAIESQHALEGVFARCAADPGCDGKVLGERQRRAALRAGRRGEGARRAQHEIVGFVAQCRGEWSIDGERQRIRPARRQHVARIRERNEAVEEVIAVVATAGHMKIKIELRARLLGDGRH